jgi:hypothetical protein
MSAHGARFSFLITDLPFQYGGFKPPADGEPVIIPSGFRHFFQNPVPSQQFAIDGVPFDPKVRKQRERSDELMRKLAGAMLLEYPRDPFNPNIPSGFTYLSQLVAHDLVDSSLFLSRSQSNPIGLSNVRSKPLRLETIFGGGPIQCPYAYEHCDGIFRDRLRLGQVRPDGRRGGGHPGDLRDIARAGN